MFEVADMQYMVDADKTIDWANGGMVANLLFFLSFSFVSVSCFFYR